LSNRGRKSLESLEEASGKLYHPFVNIIQCSIDVQMYNELLYRQSKWRTKIKRYDCFNIITNCTAIVIFYYQRIKKFLFLLFQSLPAVFIFRCRFHRSTIPKEVSFAFASALANTIPVANVSFTSQQSFCSSSFFNGTRVCITSCFIILRFKVILKICSADFLLFQLYDIKLNQHQRHKNDK